MSINSFYNLLYTYYTVSWLVCINFSENSLSLISFGQYDQVVNVLTAHTHYSHIYTHTIHIHTHTHIDIHTQSHTHTFSKEHCIKQN